MTASTDDFERIFVPTLTAPPSQYLPDRTRSIASVVDVFCGVGALSYGFREEGFSIACGFDIDESCRYAYETNIKAPFVRCDVRELKKQELVEEFSSNLPRILIGCAPCQPFSAYARRKVSKDWHLLKEFGRLVVETQPHVVSMENVPRLLTFKGGSVFKEFVTQLRSARYVVNWHIAYGPDFGLPQSRSRLVLLASRLGVPPSLPVSTTSSADHKSVRDAIGELPQLQAGETDPNDPLHRCCKLSPLNLQRIRASVPGGTWEDWQPELIADCHKSSSGASYRSVYGRMQWDQPSPTITTQFYGYGRGRFGHPEQDRGLSIREGAVLQSFPRNYRFLMDGEVTSISKVGRHIGNAVPILLARAIAKAVAVHLREAW